ncbi:perlucin-like [Ylistrum balloti]|uniref:perlucin-like n=1 Tax=Ylistrum balloti TaxID=509963 RepID=UPI002905D477|nr:perlucin-like [Ylistrum balloti]
MIRDILILLTVIWTTVQACPSGWVQHDELCYYFSVVTGSWAEAGSFCRNVNGKLAEPMQTSDVTFIDGEVQTKHAPQGEYYLGGHDTFVEGEWNWASSFSLITNANWKAGEPNDQNGKEDCLALTLSGHWNDVPCNISLPFVCEIENFYSQGAIG